MRVQLLTWQISVERTRSNTTELVSSYNNIAELWDGKIRRLGFDRAYRALFARLDRELFPQGGVYQDSTVPVLDCGLGTGALSVALCQQTRAKVWLHGVDFSPQMVAVARERLAKHKIFAQLETQDVRQLPYDDNRFGLVMSAHTLEHLADPREGLREMGRVLRPGAPLLLVMTRRCLLGSILDAKWNLNCVTPAQLECWLLEAGLSNVSFHRLGGPPWCNWMSLACVGWKRS